MKRFAAILGTLGFWAAPVAAHELELTPPTLSARAEEPCSVQERAVCQGLGQRALEAGLRCNACGPAPMPPDLVAPAHTPGAPAGRPTGSPQCLPRESGPLPPSCVGPPHLDILPRP